MDIEVNIAKADDELLKKIYRFDQPPCIVYYISFKEDNI